jgi:hypothetical protein
MQRPASARSRTGSPLSIAAPGLFPPSILATFDAAFGLLAFGTLLVGATAILLVSAWRGASRGAKVLPAVFVLAACGIGFVAYLALIFGFATVECAPDAYECPL